MIKPLFNILSDKELYTINLTPFKAEVIDVEGISHSYFIWDFGDGNFSKDRSVSHVYEHPGVYDVTLTQYLSSGEPVSSETETITAYNLIPNLIEWDDTSNKSDFIRVSKKADTPYVVNIWNSHQEYSDTIKIQLYSQNSKSIPFDPSDKNIHLKPTWRFYDEDGNIIDGSIEVEPVKLYASNTDSGIEIYDTNLDGSIFVGSFQQVKFYYVDDISTNAVSSVSDIEPVIITVTQDLSNIYNDSKADSNLGTIRYPSLFKPVFSLDNIPTQLKITSNGLFPIDYLKFENTRIPYNIFLADDEGNFIKTNPNISVGSQSYPMTIGLTKNIALSSNPPLEGELRYFLDDPFTLGGFYESYFIPLETTTESIALSASTDVDIVINPRVPLYGLFADNNNRKLIKYNFYGTLAERLENSDILSQVTETQEPEIDHDISSVFGISVDGDYGAWVADANNSIIYKYDENLSVLKSYDLTGFSNIISGHSSPAQISLDSLNKAYVTLTDSGVVLEIFDDTINEIPIVSEINTYMHSEGQGSIQPMSIEVTDDTIAVSYIESEGSVTSLSGDNLVTFDGEIITTVSPSTITNYFVLISKTDHNVKNSLNLGPIQIIDICSDRNMDYFYAVGVHRVDGSSYIYKIINDITTLAIVDQVELDGFGQFITMSESGKVWASSGDDKVASWDGVSVTYHTISLISENVGQAIGGITADALGRIWVLNNADKKLMLFNESDFDDVKQVQLSLNSDLIAYGDWNGYRWYNKFGYTQTVTTVENLYGESDEFIIEPQELQYSIQKINEDFDAKETLKGYRTTESMLNHDNFFDNFLGAIVGDKYSENTSLGKSIYEKISNFVMNHSDLETCNIMSLESFCEQFDVPITNVISYPQNIQRFIDLFSISFKKLWGDEYVIENVENIHDYVGDKLDVETYSVSADPQVNFLLKEKFNENFIIIKPIFVDDEESPSYPLSSYSEDWGWGLSIPEGEPLKNYYEVYELKPLPVEKIFSIIDWENVLTTESLKSKDNFDEYRTEHGIMSKILGNDLRRGLGLFVK